MWRHLVGTVGALFLLNPCAAAGGRNVTASAVVPPVLPAASIDWSGAEVIAMQLTGFRFELAQIALQHGKAYKLRLENADKDLHEFTAPKFFRAAVVRDVAHVLSREDQDVVVPGRTRHVYLIAPGAGIYDLFCADHDWARMTGQIVVR
jgi:plastocyanin